MCFDIDWINKEIKQHPTAPSGSPEEDGMFVEENLPAGSFWNWKPKVSYILGLTYSWVFTKPTF